MSMFVEHVVLGFAEGSSTYRVLGASSGVKSGEIDQLWDLCFFDGPILAENNVCPIVTSLRLESGRRAILHGRVVRRGDRGNEITTHAFVLPSGVFDALGGNPFH